MTCRHLSSRGLRGICSACYRVRKATEALDRMEQLRQQQGKPLSAPEVVGLVMFWLVLAALIAWGWAGIRWQDSPPARRGLTDARPIIMERV